MKLVALGLVCGGLPPAWAGAQQPPSFGVEVEAVYDVFATRKGEPLPGFGAADFVVLDQGVAQDVRLLDDQQAPLHVILMLDISESVEGDVLSSLKAASRAL